MNALSAIATTSTANAGNAANKPIPPEIKKAGDDFEAMFLSEMLSHMFAEVPVDETFGGGPGEQVFRGFLVNEYSKNMVRAGGIGISAAIQQEMISLQERAGRR